MVEALNRTCAMIAADVRGQGICGLMEVRNSHGHGTLFKSESPAQVAAVIAELLITD